MARPPAVIYNRIIKLSPEEQEFEFDKLEEFGKQTGKVDIIKAARNLRRLIPNKTVTCPVCLGTAKVLSGAKNRDIGSVGSIIMTCQTGCKKTFKQIEYPTRPFICAIEEMELNESEPKNTLYVP